MRRRSAFLAVAAFLAALPFLLVACGDNDGEDEASQTLPPTETLVTSSPADLASYRFEIDVWIMPSVLDTSEAPSGLSLDKPITLTIDGERLNPDREHAHTTANLNFLQIETESIAVGDRMWIREGSRPWEEGGSSILATYVGADFRPSVLFADDVGQYDLIAEQLRSYPSTEESLEGVPTRRFTLDQEAFYKLFQSDGVVLPTELNATLSAEIWVEQERGVPLRLEVVGVDEASDEVIRLAVRLFDLDTDDIQIEPPA